MYYNLYYNMYYNLLQYTIQCILLQYNTSMKHCKNNTNIIILLKVEPILKQITFFLQLKNL